jgi:hypothetical protein
MNHISRLVLLIMMLSCAAANAQEADHETLVAEGKATCVIVIAADAPGGKPGIPWVKEAADSIAKYIERCSGATVPVVTEPPLNRVVQLHIGETKFVRERKLKPTDIDGDGFAIAFPEPGYIVLVGGTDWGTEFAAYEFLERFVGVRWLFPGSLGEYVPQQDSLVIPRTDIRQEPAYFSRLISEDDLWGKRRANDLNIWVHRLRMHHRVNFHHNLNNLLPVAQYADTNPEWYPLVKGERIQAADAARHRHTWAAPVLDAPGLPEEIIKNIRRFFQENPDAQSVALGINDSHNWGREGGPLNSVGQLSMSDHYYPWANRVVSEVLKTHPDKWFGLLAYNEIMDPPTDSLHERVVPFITYDRHWWLREPLARRDQQRVHDWHKKAAQIGWYDYSYGRFFIAPRIYTHLMAQYLRWGAENGVRTYYSEAYPSADWHEGPKVYVQMKLLWNPWLDVDELLNEWYRCAVGEQAAPALKSYFEFWEQFWTERLVKHGWFNANQQGSTYTAYQVQGYLTALTPEDLAACERWMAEVREKAGTAEEKQRAAFFSTAWHNIRDNRILQWMVELCDEGPVARAFAANTANSERISLSDFEPVANAAHLPEGWVSWQRSGSVHGFRWDQAGGYQSNGSLVIDVNSRDLGIPAAFIYTQQVEPHRYYRVRCRVRAHNLNPAATVNMMISWGNDSSLRSYGLAKTFDTTHEGEWVVGDLVARVPAGEEVSMGLALGVSNGTHGTVWFDDVEILVLKDGSLPKN